MWGMQVHSFFQESVQASRITVEIHSRFQIPSFQILGLPAPEIQEARERIMAAFTSCGFEFPKKKVVINLAPSSVRKSGTGHDLAIAIRVLESALDLQWPERIYAWGELGLNGEIKPCGKMASLMDLLLKERTRSGMVLLSPVDARTFESYRQWRIRNALPVPQAFLVVSVPSLEDVPEVIRSGTSKNKISEVPASHAHAHPLTWPSLLPLSTPLSRVVEISITGRHHLLLLGPKGVGKSEALEWFKAILPESPPEQTWARLLFEESRQARASFETPVRQVHSQVKPAHLLGSFSKRGFQAGELALAHGGLFIADEFMEWPRDAKECLREPLQSKRVILTRVSGQSILPCDVQLVGTGNLCPCGGVPAPLRGIVGVSTKHFPCRCRAIEFQNYFQKLSGPIADRIDLIHLYAPSGESGIEFDMTPVNPDEWRKRIAENRAFANETFGKLPSDLSVHWLERNLPRKKSIETMLKRVPNLRSRHKVLRVARTLQSMERTSTQTEEQIFESVSRRFTNSPLE